MLVLLAWAVVLTIGFNYFAAYTGNAANKATSFEVDFSALADLVREDKIPSKIREIETCEAITESVMLRVSFNTSSNEARDVRISSAITSKALPKSAVTVAFPPG